jgi:hypothetical protein
MSIAKVFSQGVRMPALFCKEVVVMNETVALLEPEFCDQPAAESLPLERPRKSGLVIKPMDKDAALALLDELLRTSDPEEDRETMELLIKGIDEHRAAVGARLMFPDGWDSL